MKRERQTNNPILRAWGIFCAVLGSWLFKQADKYGDVVNMDEEFLLTYLADDSTGVWDSNAS
jgi:hypothetical protein